jgi:glycosyltransferase involved in cell wall biosynthesis
MMTEDSLRDAVKLIECSGLFDARWYATRHPDVGLLGMAPAEHYLRWGGWLGRDPGPDFDTAHYLAQAPEARASGLSPLVHFLLHGKTRGLTAAGASRGQPRGPLPAGAVPVPHREWHKLTETDLDALRQEFDAVFYRTHYLQSEPESTDPFAHFMREGWRREFDPSPEFDTAYYLRQAPDLAAGGVNPFAHYVLAGRAERRRARASRLKGDRPFLPHVSVIVPNFNHARFLAKRLDSILSQTWTRLDILVLDDASTDDSRAVIDAYCREHPRRVRALYNDANSGGVFRQWRKGLAQAKGDLVWICESDDWCEPDFLERLIPHFHDRSVQLAFGKIQFCQADGSPRPGLDAYRENAEPGIWGAALKRPAAEWFANGFGVNNLIANVGGCVWRRQDIPASVWEQMDGLRVLGDWWLYLELAGAGQIAYEPAAVAYFRQHGQNTSVGAFHSPPYYVEHQRFMTRLRRRWPVPTATVDRFLASIEHQYRHFGVAAQHGPFEQHVSREALLRQERTEAHVLLAMLSFTAGGGEVFPLNLANALRDQGVLVSILVVRQENENAEMRAALDTSIPVYYADDALLSGVDAFFTRAGVSLVHSHMVSCESELLSGRLPLTQPTPYLVTLHGSYEATGIAQARIAKFAEKVTHWAWTTPRNLEPFAGLGLPETAFTRMANAMPIDPRPFPKSRDELGIAPDAVVFTLVARGVLRKGWRASIAAFQRVRDAHPGVRMVLLLCGDGPVAEQERDKHQKDPDIRFLGYQNCISGLYRMTDCALLPTRFSGESFPLALIQALHVGTPTIATRVGEIPGMLEHDGVSAGLLIEPLRESEAFVDLLAGAMTYMLDPDLRRRFSMAAMRIGDRYAMDAVAGQYRDLYRTLLPPPQVAGG